jgi:YggT family protein
VLSAFRLLSQVHCIAPAAKLRQIGHSLASEFVFPMNLIVDILRILLNVVWWIIIVQAIMSWLIAFNVINTHNEFVRQIWGTLDRMTEPLYRPIRKILPDFGGLDLSPLVVLVGLAIIERVLVEVQYSALGM